MAADGATASRQQTRTVGQTLCPRGFTRRRCQQRMHRYSFARYADDCNVYMGSMKAGERVMALLRKLKLITMVINKQLLAKGC